MTPVPKKAQAIVKAERELSKIYYDTSHPASFSNVNKLWLATHKNIPKRVITEWLMAQDTYTRHRPKRENFRRNCYIVNNIDQLWEADLIVFPADFAQHNDGVKYILGTTYILQKMCALYIYI